MTNSFVSSLKLGGYVPLEVISVLHHALGNGVSFVIQCQSKSKMVVSSDTVIDSSMGMRGSSENIRHVTLEYLNPAAV